MVENVRILETKTTGKFGRVLVVVILAAACGAAYWMGRQTTLLNAGLTIDSRFLDFGHAWEESDFHWTLPVQNLNSKDIHILGFRTSCSCVDVHPSSLIIEGGKTAHLNVTLNLSRTKWKSSGENQFEARLFPQIKEAAFEQTGWTIRGRVEHLLTPSLLLVKFGTLVRTQTWPWLSVSVQSALPLDNLVARVDKSTAETKVVQKAKKDFVVHVRPDAKLSTGPFRFQIDLVPSVQNETLPTKKVIAEGFIVDDIAPAPSAIRFNLGKIGSTVEEIVRLTSLSDARFQLVGCEFGSPDIMAEPYHCPGEKGPFFRVKQKITKEGFQESYVDFLIDCPTLSQTRARLSVHYYGMRVK